MTPDTSLAGKAALVTGASSGIGSAIAVELARAGADVALIGRDRERLRGAVDRASVEGPGAAEGIVADLTADEGPARVIDEAVARFGRLDTVVHAAGVFRPQPLEQTEDAILDGQWETNVRAPFRLTRTAVPHLPEGGAVIFISSIAGHVGFLNSSAYCATKGAIELLVKALAAELAPRGVRVNAIAPGNVRTPINEDLLADPDYARAMIDATPAGRIGEVEDIAPAVVFLASPSARYVHGSSLLIDGGWTAV
jgi:NAD(P)-dependent dehydrogenase (short-subunit alcohol dehydrogenase family)